MPTMSVIVVNWNGKHFLDACLSALRAQTCQDFETILVDNGSEDGSVDFVRERFPEVFVLTLNQNRGFSAANNAGYEIARGDLIFLLNNDTEAHPNWLEEMQKAFREYPEAGSFASKMLVFDDRKCIDVCGFAITNAGTTIDLGRDEQDGIAWSEPRKVFGACAGAAGYRRTMLEDIGFLDEDFFMTYEDLDLSFRAQLRGYECVFVPGAIVYHHYRATMKKHPSRQVFYSQRNIEFVYLKNMPFRLMLRSLPQRLLYEAGGAAYFIRTGTAGAFLKAKTDAARKLPMMLRKRKEIQASAKGANRQLHALMVDDWLVLKWKKLWQAWRGRSPRTLKAHTEKRVS